MDEVPDFLKPFFMMLGGVNPGTWVNVAKLTGDDILRKKNHDMEARRMASQAKVLNDKLQVLIATLRANKSEFWDSIYQTYNLPSDLQYKIDDDGQVLKHVPAQPAENA